MVIVEQLKPSYWFQAGFTGYLLYLSVFKRFLHFQISPPVFLTICPPVFK